MDSIRADLNLLAMKFWCGVGSSEELSRWTDAAVMSTDELHPLIWDLYPQPSPELATALLLRMAEDVNGFQPISVGAEAIAEDILRQSLIAFVARDISVQALCRLADHLDSGFNLALADAPQPRSATTDSQWWQGDLYNCCDWCDDSWTHDNSPHLHAEAERLLRVLNRR